MLGIDKYLSRLFALIRTLIILILNIPYLYIGWNFLRQKNSSCNVKLQNLNSSFPWLLMGTSNMRTLWTTTEKRLRKSQQEIQWTYSAQMHGDYLTPDEEKMFTPQLKDLACTKNKDTETNDESEEHDTDDFHSYSTTSNSDDKSSSSYSSDSSNSSIGTQSKAKSTAREMSKKEQIEIETITRLRTRRWDG